jgi:hypothetical protein
MLNPLHSLASDQLTPAMGHPILEHAPIEPSIRPSKLALPVFPIMFVLPLVAGPVWPPEHTPAVFVG